MDKEKFQQKALKQTKQKKSKSAEFLMDNERVATEGIANPAFNISSADLSACQTSEEKVIRCDKLRSILAAHQEKLRLQTQAEPRGNECRRNYFDPLMDVEINPRQCGMEVSKEEELSLESHEEVQFTREPMELAKAGLYDKLMTFLGDENKMFTSPETPAEEKHDEYPVDSAWPVSCEKTYDLFEEIEEEAALPYIEQFEKDVRGEIIFLDSSPLQQDLRHNAMFQKFRRRLPKIFQSKKENQALKATPKACQEGTAAKFSNLAGVNNDDSNGATALCWEINWSKKPQPIQIQLKCLRGIKDKVPQGNYVLRISLLRQLGGQMLCWSKVEGQKWAGTSLPVRHNGNFYDVEICFDQRVHTDVPARKNGNPEGTLLFQLFLLRGTNTCIDQVVGWGAFPLCNNNLDTVEGKFKCPLLRGHYNSKIDRFQKIENLISSDLDHWLCNLYFQIIKLPRYSEEQKEYEPGPQLSSNQLVFATIAEKNGTSEKELAGGLQDGNDPCKHNSGFSDKHCDMAPVKEIHGRYFKLNQNCPRIGREADETVLRCASYMEELEKHRISVCCHPGLEKRVFTSTSKHFYFGVYAAFSELGGGVWYSGYFWFLILLVALLWFARLYLHYCSQWVLLHVLSVPVTKFRFYLYTVDLCYQNSLVYTSEEVAVIVVGPLTLNAVMLLIVLMRWVCQLLFGSFPSYLSKLIIAWGLWTVLDPLAVFVVDAVLGRLYYTPDKPTADCAKLYWLFLRVEGSGIPGALITALLYAILLIISTTTLYLYCVRIHNEGWLQDMLQRIQSKESTFCVPFDLEISNQELSYIVKKAEQWRGINGERRKVVIWDYIWKDQAEKSSSDFHHQDEIKKSAGNPGGTTVHVVIHTIHLGGFQEVYRQFLRLPSGAIVEAFSDIGGINSVYNEVSTVIQEHISEMDNALGASSVIKLRERKENTAK